MSKDLTPVYNEIAEYILAKEGTCVLILGLQLSVNQRGEGYKPFFRRLASDKNNGFYFYFENENLFPFSDEISYRQTRRQIKEFYKDAGDKGLLEMIPLLKFPLVINVCPDIAPNKIYDHSRIDYASAYFSKDSVPKFMKLHYPTKEKPVICNIFGSINLDTSMIVNQSNLYETIQCLVGVITSDGFFVVDLNFNPNVDNGKLSISEILRQKRQSGLAYDSYLKSKVLAE